MIPEGLASEQIFIFKKSSYFVVLEQDSHNICILVPKWLIFGSDANAGAGDL